VYVRIASANVRTAAPDTFQFDVTVANLIPQPLGTADGVSADSAGVRIYFSAAPRATAGHGSVAVANADGRDGFTAADQTFFRYGEILPRGAVSAPRTWKLRVDPGVAQLAFTVNVAAAVPRPDGWVDLSPATPYLPAGGSQALRAVVRNVVGDSVAGAVTWGTSDASVAAVDAAGRVTAGAPGMARITAASGSRTGVQMLHVCPDLGVGQAYTVIAPAAGSVCLGGAADGAEFVYVPVNLSTSAELPITITATGVQEPVLTAPYRAPAPGAPRGWDAPSAASDVPYLDPDPRVTARLLANPASRIRGPGGEATRGLRTGAATPATATVGDLVSINTATACNGPPAVRPGRVRAVSRHLVVVEDTANPAGGFTGAQYDSIALEFDSIAWPVDSAAFGAITDVDGNGRVVAFYTRAVNERTPRGAQSVLLGLFTTKDVFAANAAGCGNSNAGEILYVLVPDPAGEVNGNVRETAWVRGQTTATLGHELQHAINSFRRVYLHGTTTFEQGFLAEGLSHVAEELMFYRASGLAPRQNIDPAMLAGPAAEGRMAAFTTYAAQNMSRLRPWLQRPDTTGPFKNAPVSLAERGSVWAFLRYAADRRGGDEQALWYALGNSPLTGTANLQNALGVDPYSWLPDFIAAMYADDGAFAVSTQHRTPSWNYRALFDAFGGGFPLMPTTLQTGPGLALTYSAGGGSSFVRLATPARGFASIALMPDGDLTTPPFGLAVIRIK
ncbi:MAG TPA: Ig-like domain-containing protein, partial [Longimicrobiaceae bacterium]|nr:Ig-like domain-containing protein [Longimicrobiaceae bacterium]